MKYIFEKQRRSGTLLATTVLCLILPFGLIAQSGAVVDSFYSSSLGRVKKFAYVLPMNYDRSGKYAILYLLHGYGGNYSDWSRQTKIVEYVRAYPLIVVMPDGENSWYVNAQGDAGARFEDYMMIDLPQRVQTLFSIDTTRQAIAGLSMGGVGSLVLAMRHPAQFRFAGSLSGAISVPHFMDDTSRQARKNLSVSLIKAYGEKPGPFRDDHDVLLLYTKLTKETSPYFYLVTGVQDQFRDFLPTHRELTNGFRTIDFAYEYHETPGNHSWPYWDREIQPLLKRMSEVLRLNKK